jgi:hypothetical protein
LPIGRDEISLADLVTQNRFGSCGVLARNDCFQAVGHFDESLRSAEDRDMWIRIAARYRVVRLRASLWWYRMTPGSMSRNPERMEQFTHKVLEKAFDMPALAGRWQLRRKAKGIVNLEACFVYRESGQYGKALKRIVRSYLWWPFSYSAAECDKTNRVRVLASTLRSIVSGTSGSRSDG